VGEDFAGVAVLARLHHLKGALAVVAGAGGVTAGERDAGAVECRSNGLDREARNSGHAPASCPDCRPTGKHRGMGRGLAF